MTLFATPAPWLKMTGLVRAHGIGGAWYHCKTVGLHRAMTVIDRRIHPRAQNDRTGGKVELDDVTIVSPHRTSGVNDLPTPWRVLDWVHAALPAPSLDWTFVDLGCGKGRALISATDRTYGRIVGVEFASELAENARANVASSATSTGTPIEIVSGDATEYEWPTTPLVVFMFNPFGPAVLRRVMHALVQTNRATPRPIVIAYLNPVHADMLDNCASLTCLPLTFANQAKFSALSPYALRLYGTAEAIGSMQKSGATVARHAAKPQSQD